MIRMVLFAALLLALGSSPLLAQRAELGPIRGFVYHGALAQDGGAARWADYPIVVHVFAGSPAEAAGVRVGDRVLRVNGRDGTAFGGYRGGGPGATYTLVVQRGFREVEISFVLVEPTWLASEWTPPGGSFRTP
jgi:S1-C subfamily serine protease